MKILRNPHLISLVVILIFLSFVSVGNFYEHKRLEEIEMCQTADLALKQAAFGYPDETIIAKAFHLYNFSKNRKILGRNEYEVLPLASLTKLMTIRIVLKNQNEPKLYTVRDEDLGSDGSVGFVAGDTFEVSDLVRSALVASSNHAAVMLARSTGLSDDTFMQVMNVEAKNLGLSSLQFQSVTGLDTESLDPTAVGTAEDILLLLLKNNQDFPETMMASTLPTTAIAATNGRGIKLENTNDALLFLDTFIAGKTGYTKSAGGNLAVLWRDEGGELLGGVVLGSTEEGRFLDMIALHDGANRYLSSLEKMPTVCKNINYHEHN